MEFGQAKKRFKTETMLSVASRLYNASLVTEEEKQALEVLQPMEMKAAIYDLMSEKDLEVATEILTVMRPVKEQVRHPLETDTVVRTLFEFVDFDDLKTCRVVCKKWNSLAEPLMRKKTTICFGLSRFGNSMSRNLAHFVETFRPVQQTELPLSCFRFENNVHWLYLDLKLFIHLHNDVIQELQFCEVNLRNESGHFLEEYDISGWFQGFPIRNLTMSCDGNENEEVTNLPIFSNVITSAKQITLHKCNVTIGNIPMCPTYVDFTDLKCWKDGNKLLEYCINDLVDFSEAKDIIISCQDRSLYTVPILDLAKCIGVSANDICLKNIQVVNWRESTLAVKVLNLIGIPFLEKTQMDIKELLFLGDSKIDLFVLPMSIEKLHLSTRWARDISSSQPATLPNLKNLTIGRIRNLKHLIHFKKCKNLRDLELYVAASHGNDSGQLNLDWIPFSVKRMKLEGIENVKGPLCPRKRFDVLVLEDYSFSNAAKVLKRINPDMLVLQWEMGKQFENNDCVILFLQKFKSLVLVVGPFTWDDSDNVFERSRLMAHVDKKADYYAFENNQGRSMERCEFWDQKNLDKN